jgi:hypothetical protein
LWLCRCCRCRCGGSSVGGGGGTGGGAVGGEDENTKKEGGGIPRPACHHPHHPSLPCYCLLSPRVVAQVVVLLVVGMRIQKQKKEVEGVPRLPLPCPSSPSSLPVVAPLSLLPCPLSLLLW